MASSTEGLNHLRSKLLDLAGVSRQPEKYFQPSD